MVAFESLDTVSYSHSIVTMAYGLVISEKKRDMVENLDFFSYTPAFYAPVWGGGRHRNTAMTINTKKQNGVGTRL